MLPRLVVPWPYSLDAKLRGPEPSADSEYEMDCLSKAQSTTCFLGSPGHRGPTDVEDDRPPHPKMARAVSASGLYGSIVTFHAVKYLLYACELTN